MKQSEQIEKLITANGGMIQTSQITDVGCDVFGASSMQAGSIFS